MKKGYMKPTAEKVVFDYAENVVAGSNDESTWGGCNCGGNQMTIMGDPNGLHTRNGVHYYKDQKVNSNPYGGWACKSTDHHGCYQF